jgi:UDP-2-acetamido-2,6-beta-L-arabino-hexul-4-ose reductase
VKVLITGADGFIARNLAMRLAVTPGVDVLDYRRQSDAGALERLVLAADFVFHLAGVNRAAAESDFLEGNIELTRALCAALESHGKATPVVYSSSAQADLNNHYGRTKRGAEQLLVTYAERTGARVGVFRLPNVFGKWSRPNYNSVVATFCHNVARDLPIRIDDPHHMVRLVYIDDVIDAFTAVMRAQEPWAPFCEVGPCYPVTVGELAELIRGFRASRTTLTPGRVGTGFVRALYATYVSYLPPAQFAYALPQYGDDRGVFVEMLRTLDSGQFSFFTAHPGITRGGHYHHSKTEKFLVIKGRARFRFRHIVSNEFHELHTSGEEPSVVETIPGWAHDITNVGDGEMVVMLWANEIFDRARPDTYAHKV